MSDLAALREWITAERLVYGWLTATTVIALGMAGTYRMTRDLGYAPESLATAFTRVGFFVAALVIAAGGYVAWREGQTGRRGSDG